MAVKAANCGWSLKWRRCPAPVHASFAQVGLSRLFYEGEDCRCRKTRRDRYDEADPVSGRPGRLYEITGQRVRASPARPTAMLREPKYLPLIRSGTMSMTRVDQAG